MAEVLFADVWFTDSTCSQFYFSQSHGHEALCVDAGGVMQQCGVKGRQGTRDWSCSICLHLAHSQHGRPSCMGFVTHPGVD